MTVSDVRVYRYALPLVAPLSVGEHALTTRRGLLLRVAGKTDAVGWGEAAPLPGFSPEPLDEATEQARQLAHTLYGTAGTEWRQHGARAQSPAVRFAGESALLTSRASSRGQSVMTALGGGASTVALNALLTDSVADLAAAGRRLRHAGYRAVKLKVGRGPVERDAARVATLQEVLGEEGSLRLDANRAWSYEAAVAFAAEVDTERIAYVEEPLADPRSLRRLVEETGLPVALDETTREQSPGVLDSMPFVRAVVLKPTLLGGIAATRRWVDRARASNVVPVISASYESGVGMRMLVVLAAALTDAPAGLSTYSRLETDTLRPRLSLDRAEVDIASLWNAEVEPARVDLVEHVH